MEVAIKKVTEVIQYIYQHKSNITVRDVMHEFSNEHGDRDVDEILHYLVNEQMIRIDGDRVIHWLYIPEVEGLNEDEESSS
jgi:hypothetical protein